MSDKPSIKRSSHESCRGHMTHCCVDSYTECNTVNVSHNEANSLCLVLKQPLAILFGNHVVLTDLFRT